MTFGWRRTAPVLVATLFAGRLNLVSAASQVGPEQNAQMSENVFKNIQVLKGIPVDEFMDTMGMFAASLGFDCSSCHDAGIRTNREAFAITTPAIQRARGMMTMMNSLNRASFGGQQRVTCFTCHRGNYRPEVVPDLRLQYGEVVENPNGMVLVPDRKASADQIFDTYFQALGGTERLADRTSFVASGTYSGFNTGGAEVPVEVFAKAPDRRTVIVRMPEGASVETYDGRSGWVTGGWRPLPLMTLTGGNLAGARIDAMMSFPAGIQKAFSQWQVGSATIDGRLVHIVQGANTGQLPVNLYFDDSGLLVRQVRWSQTAVGVVPIQVEYADHRDVGGIKIPFRTIVTWTDGQSTIQLRDVRPNVPIDDAMFARPAPFRRQPR